MKFNRDDWAVRGGVEPITEVSTPEYRQPSARQRPAYAGFTAFDASEQRLGIHYRRLPYFSRDYWHAAYRSMWKFFTSMETGSDINQLERHWDLKLVGFAGLTSNSDPEDVAKAHVAIRQRYRYESAYLVALAQSVLNISRKTGFGNLTERASPTLKFSVINSMISKIANFPVDKKYVAAFCLSACDLVSGSKEHGLIVACPDVMPVGQAYLQSVKALTGDTGWNVRSYLPPLVGEYVKGNAHDAAFSYAQRGFGLAAKPGDYTGTWTSVAGLSKQKGWFWDHMLERLQDAVDKFYDHWINNQVSCLNIAVPGNRVAEWYSELGDFTDRVTFTDIVKYVDAIKSVDLKEYAARNFRFMAEISPVLRFDADPAILADFTDPSASSWELPTRDYIEAAADLSAMPEVPYLGLKIAETGGTLDNFLEGTKADVVGLASFDPVSYEASWKQIVSLKMNSYLTSQKRYVDPASLGAYLKPIGEGNIFAYQANVRRGKMFPMWGVTPMIDPNDPMMNGIFTIVDVVNQTPRKGTWEDLVHQLSLLASHASGYTNAEVTTKLGSLVNYTVYTQLATDSMIEKNANVFGGMLMFLGDAGYLPSALQLLRADVCYLAYGSAVLSGNVNWFPAAPYRRVPCDFSLHPASAALTPAYTPMLSDVVAEFTSLKDGITLTSMAAAMTNTIVSVDFKSHPEMILAPQFAPSMRRPLTEYTDNGMFMFFKSFFDYDKAPRFGVVGAGASAGSAKSLPRGFDQQKDKTADREKERVAKRRDFPAAKRSFPPRKPWAKDTTSASDERSGVVGENGRTPITDAPQTTS